MADRRVLIPALRRAISLGLIFLFIEFFDELIYGVQTAALPQIRLDLDLTYAQIGLLLGLPNIISIFIEPVLMLLGDTNLRKRLVVGGGMVILIALLLTATASSFGVLLAAFILFYPASGAFVSLSQATLIDLNRGREHQSMARWTVYGSIGNLLGPAFLAGVFALGLSWRSAYWAMTGLGLILVITLIPRRFPILHAAKDTTISQVPTGPVVSQHLRTIQVNLRQALTNRSLLSWVGLVSIADLLLDIFLSYSILYFSDVVGLSAAQTSLVLTALMIASLIADLILIPLLERVPGRSVVRASAAAALIVYPAFLLVPWIWVKIILVIAIRFTTLGWYPVLKGETYAAAPGRSGTVEAVNSMGGLISGALAWLVGLAANQYGLSAAMWLLLAAPVTLLLGVPKVEPEPQRN